MRADNTRLLKQLSLTRQQVAPPARPLPRQVDTTIHLDNLGWSLAWVGEHFGVDPPAVLNQLGDVASGPATPTADLGPDALAVSRRTINDGASTDPPHDDYADVSWQGAFRSPW